VDANIIAGQADIYFGVTFPQLQDVKREVPDAICDSFLVNGSRNLIVNRGAPPFDNPDLRRAMSLTLDRQAFIDIMGQGNGAIGGPMEPPPEGLWGMPAEMLKALPGYGPDVAQRRAEARQVMEKLGYGPDKRLAVTVAARNVLAWRDPALILIDQLKAIYIDGELEPVDTTQWYPRRALSSSPSGSTSPLVVVIISGLGGTPHCVRTPSSNLSPAEADLFRELSGAGPVRSPDGDGWGSLR
jgi:peptide/nickel transport system substrate-binding protein